MPEQMLGGGYPSYTAPLQGNLPSPLQGNLPSPLTRNLTDAQKTALLQYAFSEQAQNQEQPGLVSRIGSALVSPFKKYGQFVGEAGNLALSKLADPSLKNYKPVFMSREELDDITSSRLKTLGTAVQRAAGVGAYLVPGKGLATALTAGGLAGFSQGDLDDPADLLKKTAQGAAFSGGTYGILKGVGYGANKYKTGKILKQAHDFFEKNPTLSKNTNPYSRAADYISQTKTPEVQKKMFAQLIKTAPKDLKASMQTMGSVASGGVDDTGSIIQKLTKNEKMKSLGLKNPTTLKNLNGVKNAQDLADDFYKTMDSLNLPANSRLERSYNLEVAKKLLSEKAEELAAGSDKLSSVEDILQAYTESLSNNPKLLKHPQGVEIENILKQFGPKSSQSQLNSFKYTLDDLAGGFENIQGSVGTVQAKRILKAMRNVVRGELGKNVPGINPILKSSSNLYDISDAVHAMAGKSTSLAGPQRLMGVKIPTTPFVDKLQQNYISGLERAPDFQMPAIFGQVRQGIGPNLSRLTPPAVAGAMTQPSRDLYQEFLEITGLPDTTENEDLFNYYGSQVNSY